MCYSYSKPPRPANIGYALVPRAWRTGPAYAAVAGAGGALGTSTPSLLQQCGGRL
ncbi:MAG: hypothetical protein ACLUFL_02730 [Flavonifractor plautii]